jgi:hypothetical protein
LCVSTGAKKESSGAVSQLADSTKKKGKTGKTFKKASPKGVIKLAIALYFIAISLS